MKQKWWVWSRAAITSATRALSGDTSCSMGKSDDGNKMEQVGRQNKGMICSFGLEIGDLSMSATTLSRTLLITRQAQFSDHRIASLLAPLTRIAG